MSHDGGEGTEDHDLAFLAFSMLASTGDAAELLSEGEDSEEDSQDEDTGDESVSKRARTPPLEPQE
jgi:hypothetical protein